MPWNLLPETVSNREKVICPVPAAEYVDIDSPAIELHPGRVGPAAVGTRNYDQRRLPDRWSNSQRPPRPLLTRARLPRTAHLRPEARSRGRAPASPPCGVMVGRRLHPRSRLLRGAVAAGPLVRSRTCELLASGRHRRSGGHLAGVAALAGCLLATHFLKPLLLH